VHELPVQFIDPDLYVCGNCLSPKPGQLDIGERTETRRYDPSISRMPH
jgi:hypothetical protein